MHRSRAGELTRIFHCLWQMASAVEDRCHQLAGVGSHQSCADGIPNSGQEQTRPDDGRQQDAGFAQVLENLESTYILRKSFPGLENLEKHAFVGKILEKCLNFYLTDRKYIYDNTFSKNDMQKYTSICGIIADLL